MSSPTTTISPVENTISRSAKFKNLATYYIAFILLGMMVAIMGPTLPGLADNTRSSISQISYVFTSHAIGYLIGSLIAGRLYDKLPGHRILAIDFGLVLGLLFLIPLFPVLWLLLTAVVLIGVAEGIMDVGCNALLMWVARPNVGPWMNALHFFFGAGGFIAPMIVAQSIFSTGNITWAYWTLGLLTLPILLWIIRLPSPAIHVAPHSESGSKSNNLFVLLLAILIAAYVGTEASFSGWIYTYVVKLGLGDPTRAAFLTSTFWGAFTIGRLLSIPVAARIRPLWILLVDLLGSTLSLGVILLWPSSQTVLWAGSAGAGLFMASIFPTCLLFAGERMTITGRITSYFFVGCSLGSMFLPWLIGQLFERIGPSVTMVTIFITLVVDLVIFAILVAYTRSRYFRAGNPAG